MQLTRVFLSLAALSYAWSCTLTSALPAEPAAPAETKQQRDARMAWWREAKFGMFIHWGTYAVAAGYWDGKWIGGAGEWLMHDGKIPVADYQTLAAKFNPTKFDADRWVAVAKAAGMKYIVITAKHHEGFAMFKSAASPYNIVDATPYHHDPLADLARACQKAGIKLGFYYSQDQDWTAPGGAAYGGHWDKAQDGDFAQYMHGKVIPQLKELLTNYQPSPAVIWFDTPKNMTPELAGEIVALLKEHPGLIWNNRLGGGQPGDTETPEQHIPATGFPGRDWETCMTINNTWGYRKDDTNWKSTATLLHNLIDIASKGGNYLLNVGPTAEGVIPQPEVDRLKAMGAWLAVNGDAIYGTQANPFPKAPSWGRVTRKGNTLYLSVFDWPASGKLVVPMKNAIEKAYLLAKPDVALKTAQTDDGAEIDLPPAAPDPIASVVAVQVQGEVDPLPPTPLFADAKGAFQLAALDAELGTADGKTLQAKVETRGGQPNIGYWMQEGDYARWHIAPAPGKYHVSIEYAEEAAKERGYTLEGADTPLHGKLAPTGSWEKFKTADAGTITLPGTKQATLTLMPDDGQGGFVNLRKITLTPEP